MIKIIECSGKNVPFGSYLEHDITSKNDVLLLKKGTVVDSRVKGLLNNYNGIIKVSVEISDKVKDAIELGKTVENDNSLVLDDTIKERTLKGVEYMYSIADSKDAAIVARDTSAILLNTVKRSSAINISLKDLKVSDDYTFKHCVDVATMAILVGQSLGLRQSDISDAATAGILHDLGKTKIPDEILNKPGRLTDEEFNIIKQHPIYGYGMLEKSRDVSENVKRGVLMHHEKVDGTGYPLRITSEKIGLIGKLLAVVDVYDALVTKRPYRDDMIEPVTAIEMMLSMGNQFDAEFLRSFLQCVILYPIGSSLMLSNKKVYTVVAQNIGYPLRPVVSDVITGEKLNLLTDRNCFSLTIVAGV